MLHQAQFFRNLERKIGHEIFVKTEKTEYLSNQLTLAHFDRKFIFPIKIGILSKFSFFGFPKCFKFPEALLLTRVPTTPTSLPLHWVCVNE